MTHATLSRATILRAVAAITFTAWFATHHQAVAQNAVLAEMYGRGVHAYYGGNHNDAYNLLSMAINNGSKDPRAYYFRGIVADAQGRSYEAEADWQRGAELEAAGGANPLVGRSLARYQGRNRLKLEQIRQKARLQALAMAAARSQARYGEINSMQPPMPAMAQPSPGVAPPRAVTPPPAPDMGNPFGDDQAGVVAGEPTVQSDDAFEGAMEPAASPAAAAGAPADASDPFATPSDGGSAPADDPFATPPADDPFAPSDDSAPADDPFAPADDAMDDPFATDGDDPFAS